MQGIYLNLGFLGGFNTLRVPDNALACFMDGSAKLKAVGCTEQLLLAATQRKMFKRNVAICMEGASLAVQ